MSRQVAITKRIDLSDISEGWDGCYAIVTGASWNETREASTFDETGKDANLKAADFAVELAKKHFVKGEIMILDDNGDPQLVPMLADDITSDAEITNRIAKVIMGGAPDPKGSSTPKETSSTDESSNGMNDTKTQ